MEAKHGKTEKLLHPRIQDADPITDRSRCPYGPGSTGEWNTSNSCCSLEERIPGESGESVCRSRASIQGPGKGCRAGEDGWEVVAELDTTFPRNIILKKTAA